MTAGGTPDRVKGAFDAAAPGYDGLRRMLIPCFDEFYRATVDALGFPPGASPRVLDLGAGTGLLAEQVLARWPRARLVLLDLSTDMLERARARFAVRNVRIEIRAADYLRDPLGGPYDAVVSALSIHHLPDTGKRALFRRAFAALRPGGRFVDADNVLAPTPALAAADRRRWIARVRESGIGDADLAAALLRTRLDVLAPLGTQLGWLRRAGFVDVDCRYKWLHFAVFGGRRPGPARRPAVTRGAGAPPRPSRPRRPRSARPRSDA
jgi:tRNA (cmo5U34)-methyltransferase